MDRKVLIGLAVGGVILLAMGFRFYDITRYPPGLFPDQAANGDDALLILHGDIRPFYPRGNGREALFFFMQALAIKLFGIKVWPMFATSAVVGTLTVIATYFATKVYFGELAGFFAALFMATNQWHVTLSRTGFRAILIPLFVALFTAFVGYTIQSVRHGKRKQAWLFAASAGAAFAGGFYTYIAYRVIIGVIAGVVVFLLLAALHPKIGFPHFRWYWREVLIGSIAAVIVFTPLAIYFARHPGAFVGRAGQVSIFNPHLQEAGGVVPTLAKVTKETIFSFFVGKGDLNWRHNVAGFPLLNPLVGLLFLLGLAFAIHGLVTVVYEIIRGRTLDSWMIFPYLLLLLAGMLVPVITTAEGIPHGLRSLGLAFPIFVLAGVAAATVIHWWQQLKISIVVRALSLGAIIAVLVLGVLYDGSLYFLIARNTPEAYAAYRGDLTDVAAFINDYRAKNPNKPRPYLALDKFSVQTIHFLCSVAAHDYLDHPDEAQHKYTQVDPEKSEEVLLDTDDIIIFTQSTLVDADRYAKRYPDVEVMDSRHNRFGEEIMRVYRLKASGSGQSEERGNNALDAQQ
jgi:hypothetical protein